MGTSKKIKKAPAKKTKQPAKTRASLTENRNGATVRNIKRLAVLETSETALIIRGLNTINSARDNVRLLEAGQNAVWAVLRTKYDLPDEFSFDPTTGEITPQEEEG